MSQSQRRLPQRHESRSHWVLDYRLLDEEFEEFEASEPLDTRTTSSYSSASSDSTTPLSPDHPLTRTTPTRASFYHRTASITVCAQPAMSPGNSARVAE
ncbi:hypothetical protein Tco_0402770, partial [Tanacetum coccineum]